MKEQNISYPLLPSQLMHLEDNTLLQPERFNIDVVLALKIKPDLDELKTALQDLVNQHDSLRSRFEIANGHWRQIVEGPVDDIPLEVVDITSVDEAELFQTIERICEEKQSQGMFNLNTGELIRFYLFRGPNEIQLLWIIAHHLVMDGASLGIFAKALNNRLDKNTEDEQPTPPGDAIEIRMTWYNSLKDYVNSTITKEERQYWLNMPAEQMRALPIDFPGSESAKTVETVQTHQYVFDNQTTRRLLKIYDSTKDFKIKFDELILYAFAQTINSCCESDMVTIKVVDSGRGLLYSSHGIDISGLVGFYAIGRVLPLPHIRDGNAVEIMKSLQAETARIPGGGFGLQLLQYLCDDVDYKKALNTKNITPRILFNYLGKIKERNDALLQRVPINTGYFRHPKERTEHDIECNILVANGHVIVNLHYSEKQFKPSTVDRWTNTYVNLITDFADQYL